jgi:sigma-B regulation protein RsbU (phosphoserine phosphatase)
LSPKGAKRAETAAARAELTLHCADGSRERFPLHKEKILIGRSRDCDIVLPDQWLSRRQAQIKREGDGFYLSDLGSRNGTVLNGNKIKEACLLHPGDTITLGTYLLSFSWEEPYDSGEDEPIPGISELPLLGFSDIDTKPAIDPEELARQSRVLGVLTRAASAMLVHRPLTELFELLLDLLLSAVRAERGAIMLLEGQPPQPHIRGSRSVEGGKLTRVSRGIVQRVLQERVSLLIPNVMEDPTLRSRDSLTSLGIRSALCAPLWLAGEAGERDEVIGLVYLDTTKAVRSFNEEDLRILTALANLAAAKIQTTYLMEANLEKRRLEDEMRRAAEIQSGLLPGAPPRVDGYDLVAASRPCRAVGGDYFDFRVHGGRVTLALGDVAGKGTGAALLMGILRAAVRAHWAEASLIEAITRINGTICQNVPENRYMTFFLAQLDPATGQLAYVNAGHNPPLLVRAGGAVERLEEGGLVIGMFDNVPYLEGAATLQKGDVLLVYSDGVTETWNAAGDEFGEQRLAGVVSQNPGKDAAALEAEILRALEQHAAGAKATDDRTLIVLRRQ